MHYLSSKPQKAVRPAYTLIITFAVYVAFFIIFPRNLVSCDCKENMASCPSAWHQTASLEDHKM